MNGADSLTNRKVAIRAGDALRRSPVPAIRHLTIQESQENLVLLGRLPSLSYLKLARDTVAPFLAGRTLVDQVILTAKG